MSEFNLLYMLGLTKINIRKQYNTHYYLNNFYKYPEEFPLNDGIL